MKLRAKMMSLDIITSFPFWSSSCRPTRPCRYVVRAYDTEGWGDQRLAPLVQSVGEKRQKQNEQREGSRVVALSVLPPHHLTPGAPPTATTSCTPPSCVVLRLADHESREPAPGTAGEASSRRRPCGTDSPTSGIRRSPAEGGFRNTLEARCGGSVRRSKAPTPRLASSYPRLSATSLT